MDLVLPGMVGVSSAYPHVTSEPSWIWPAGDSPPIFRGSSVFSHTMVREGLMFLRDLGGFALPLYLPRRNTAGVVEEGTFMPSMGANGSGEDAMAGTGS